MFNVSIDRITFRSLKLHLVITIMFSGVLTVTVLQDVTLPYETECVARLVFIRFTY